MNKEEKELIELLENCIASDLWYEINNDNATILGSYINKLQQENKQLKEDLEEVSNNHAQLVRRSVRAIEYIDKEVRFVNMQEYYKLLEILRGDSNE